MSRNGKTHSSADSQKIVDTARAAIFCTALIDSDPQRYQSWINYYTSFFAGEDVDLFLYNDGPVSATLDMKEAHLVSFREGLGRQDVWIFPGWKRSFSTAVRELGSRYACLAHVESDTIILNAGRAEFLQALRSPGYRTGYSARHRFVETAIQVLNTKRARDFFTTRYADPSSLHQFERFEKVVQYALQPDLFLHGERVEGGDIDLRGNYTYLSQMPIYRFCELFPHGDVPWIPTPQEPRWLNRVRVRAMRLRWAIGYLEKTMRNRLR